ncbi:MAG: hypothetical protein NVS3B26_01440 [Mycobacteriales bacterium]
MATSLGGFDRVAIDHFASADFDRLLVETVRTTLPAHEHEQFIAHYGGLPAAWVRDAGQGFTCWGFVPMGRCEP